MVNDIFSIETSFVLFLFAGWFKNLGYFRSVPIDLTLLFCALTIGLIGTAMLFGRLRPAPPGLTQLSMILFTCLLLASLAWSSFTEVNIDKALRFLFLTSPSFFIAHILAQDSTRRRRFILALTWFCAALLLYYYYARYVLGIAMEAGGKTGANNYLEYGAAANYLYICCLALAVLGSARLSLAPTLGIGASLYGLLIIGGRGPFALALMAVALVALALLRHRPRLWRNLALLFVLAAAAAAAYIALRPAGEAGRAAGGFTTLQRYQSQMSGDDTRSMDERRGGRQLAVRMWLENPVFGAGIGEFKVIDSVLEYPHNTMLEILTELGLAGGFLYLCVSLRAVPDAVRLLKDAQSAWTDMALALLFVTQFASLMTVEGYLADDRVFFAFTGLVIGSRALTSRDPRRGIRRAAAPAGPRSPATGAGPSGVSARK